MSDASDNPAPAPSPGLIARLAAAISNSTPAPEPDAALNALQASFDALQADHTALVESATLAADKLEALQVSLTEAQSEIVAKDATLTAVEAALPGSTKAANVAEFVQAQVAAKAQEQIATSGFKPNEAPAIDQSAGSDEHETMALSDFNKLSVSARNEFMSKGGKLKD